MKAQNLTICVPYQGCDKSCPYCISKMTGITNPSNWELMERNIPKVRQLAESCQVNNVLVTGKGEPTLALPYLYQILSTFREFPLELQTNGKGLLSALKSGKSVVIQLQKCGLDTLAISIDNYANIAVYKPLFEEIRRLGMTSRITVNLCNTTLNHTFEKYVQSCNNNYVDQLSFRSVTVPNYVVFEVGTEAERVADWIKKNVDPVAEKLFLGRMNDSLKEKGQVLRNLPYGATLYDYKGLSVTYFDYCIQDKSGEEDVRSLIFQDDGHVYTSWVSKASRLF